MNIQYRRFEIASRSGFANLVLSTLLISTLLLASCSPRARVGALQTESQSVELGDATSVRVEIDYGAGDLKVTGSAEKLLEADFTYNVARLKPEVKYTDGTLAIRQPEANGLPSLVNITEFRNDWGLNLNGEVPMDLRVKIGGGTGDLQLASLSLTHLTVDIGAGEYRIDLSGGWERDLDVTIDAGAADITVILPQETGVRVEVESGPTIVETQDLTKDGNIYTNDAYGVSEVTMQVSVDAGIGRISLE